VVSEGNDNFLRCECGKEVSTDAGVSNHYSAIIDDLTSENERLREAAWAVIRAANDPENLSWAEAMSALADVLASDDSMSRDDQQ
jgi:hypothetical protein